MARAVILLLLVVAVASISAYPEGQKCGENEEFNACGSQCPITCQNSEPSVCTLACIPGCDCADGYVKNAQGKCVLVQNC